MIGKTLSHYEIISMLGKGGMGEVYKAKDTKLSREVAIKVLPLNFSRDANRLARFRQEAKLLASLNHPNICQIFDIGDDYLVLEYVKGKSLSKPLSEKVALGLAIQISSGLEAAHKKGIIHRDLKPGNIMVTDEGVVKLLDFGLAKLYLQDDSISNLPNEEPPATKTGMVLGTVYYMSPEQAQGRQVDERSDIFSFGLILYEILSGRRAFSGGTPLAFGYALINEDPAPLQTPTALEKIVRRCLMKQPSDRYRTVSELKSALEQLFAEMSLNATAEMEPSIAVLPFLNMSGDKEQEYFSDGLAEEIINALAQISGLKVIARTSSFSFRGKEQDIRRIAEALNVTNILEGSVRKAGNRIRVAAQLITAADGSHLWSVRYDRDMSDVFAIQDEISQAIAEKLRVGLSGKRPLVKHNTENVEAYNLYLKGYYHLKKHTKDGLEKSKEYFEQALAIDRNFALAWYGLANFYDLSGYIGMMSPKTARAHCHQAVTKALELDEMVPQAHSMLAVLQACEYDWEGAEREFRRAQELDPNSVEPWSFYVFFYFGTERNLDRAILSIQRAAELDPLSGYAQLQLANAYAYKKQYDLALQHYQNAMELSPNSWLPQGNIAWLFYLQTGKFNEAIQYAEATAQLSGRLSSVLMILGSAYALGGRIGEARKIIDELDETAHKVHVSATAFAAIYTALGEADKALDWLDKAVEEHDYYFIQCHQLLPLYLLHSHPRYHALLHKMNLEV